MQKMLKKAIEKPAKGKFHSFIQEKAQQAQLVHSPLTNC